MQDLLEHVKGLLRTHTKKTITLFEIQQKLPAMIERDAFNHLIQECVTQGFLTASQNGRYYTLNKQKLNADKIHEMLKVQIALQSDIQLDVYLNGAEGVWEQDKAFVRMIDAYLSKHPYEEMTAPEWSYRLVGDEKWIDEKGGKRVLQRIGVWDKLPIVTYNDPMMLAINRVGWDTYMTHLIVENKSVFYRLMEVIEELPIASLSYGGGWGVESRIRSLPQQLGLSDEEVAKHRFYYFGDLDWEGIVIWEHISDKTLVAVPFYEQMLAYAPSFGKGTQKRDEEALQHFLEAFPEDMRINIQALLNEGGYMPQEALTTKELLESARRLG